MSSPGAKMTVYSGENSRSPDGRLLVDELLERFTGSLESVVVLRGIEGFGRRHPLQTSRQLTLSEDLPVALVAVDRTDRIERSLAEVRGLLTAGLITVSPGSLPGPDGELPAGGSDALRLTVFLGRGSRPGGRPVHVAAVDLLHDLEVEGATVLVGVDGIRGGERRRTRFFSSNREVPLTVTAIGGRERIGRAARRLAAMPGRPAVFAEPLGILKRDGRRLPGPGLPTPPPDRLPTGVPEPWLKLTVYSGEQSRHSGRPLYFDLVRRLRVAGAPGVTVLRGIRGYHGDHALHGDRLFSLRRRVPVVTEVIDRPERIAGWFATIDELTDRTGLVTVEPVPTVVPAPVA